MHLTSLCTQIRIWESSLVCTLCDSIYIIRERKDNVKCDVRKGRIEFFQFWKHFTLSWYIDDRKIQANHGTVFSVIHVKTSSTFGKIILKILFTLWPRKHFLIHILSIRYWYIIDHTQQVGTNSLKIFCLWLEICNF